MNISLFKNCAFCGACYHSCPKKAISINKNTLFYSFTVDQELCIECGACVAVCPVNGDFSCTSPISALAGWHKDDYVVQSSSSGGAFYTLAKKVLDEDGIVFGAAYSDNFKTVVFRSTDEIPLERLQKSKYVESLVEDSFFYVENELRNGRKVLFCGTPCQVAGLKCYLKKDYEHLLTCDFACGGVPSHKIYDEYLQTLENKYNSAIKQVDFRPKTFGWKRYAMLIDFQNGKRYSKLAVEDAYLKSFLYGKYTVRDYCLKCKFSDHHFSDITIADFWMHKQYSNLTNDNGISLILCNTEKGQNAAQDMKNCFVFQKLDVSQVSYNHKKTQTTEQKQENRKAFLKMCEESGFLYTFNQFFSNSIKDKIKILISKTFHRRLRRGKQ